MTNTGFGDSRDVVPNMAPAYRYVKNLDGQKLELELDPNNKHAAVQLKKLDPRCK